MKITSTKFVMLSLTLGLILIIGTTTAQGQQLRRRQQQQEQYLSELREEDPEAAPLTIRQREHALNQANKSLKVRLDQVELSRRAYEEREIVLENREVALDVRDADLDVRSRDLDRRILQTDKRLKEREGRVAQRESELAAKEQDILRMADAREQEIERLSRERETNAALREKALIERENRIAKRERTLGIQRVEFKPTSSDSTEAGTSNSSTGPRPQRLRLRPGNSRRVAIKQTVSEAPQEQEQEEPIIEATTARILRRYRQQRQQ